MSSSSATWPCPACAEVIPGDHQGCTCCGISAEWVDLLRALDFAIRRFHYWKLEGCISEARYRAIINGCGRHLDRWLRLAQAGEPAPTDSGLSPRCLCWSCGLTCHPSAHYCPDCSAPLGTDEVRLLRYQQFLVGEVQRQRQAGRLTEAEAHELLSGAPERLSQLRDRLDRERFFVSSR
jgi:hypothetical protein